MSPETVRYGPDRAQVAEVWRPKAADGAVPVVVLVHGGFWRQRYTKGLMHRLARAVTGQGWLAYNIEYRRVGRTGQGGWPQTFEDVSDAVDALAGVGGADLERVATCGHSAGGHLALWAAAGRASGDPRRPKPVVEVAAAASLAGVVDLDVAARQLVGRGAVQALMGGGPDEVPDRYLLGSPAALLPLGKPQLLLHGLADDSVPPVLSERYAETAVGLGDPAVYLPLPGVGHMEVISGRGAPYAELAAWLHSVFSALRPGG
ncbi:MAG TPA: prolyl oligopeptidase family serine peptidase [Acidimicrobiales bacterium]|jgi:acetyl esterase/lipase|nr:prolyl oligopeptidase family serine peptidase [Acidimicrobiales bacterium]